MRRRSIFAALAAIAGALQKARAQERGIPVPFEAVRICEPGSLYLTMTMKPEGECFGGGFKSLTVDIDGERFTITTGDMLAELRAWKGEQQP